RARFAYNLEDEHVAALAAEVPILAQWDDHETHNNWWPGQVLEDDRYHTARRASVMSAHARRAMIQWTPRPHGPVHRALRYGPLPCVTLLVWREFRTPIEANRGATGARLVAEQARWFGDAVAGSRARWKIIACDQPVGLVIGDGPNNARNEGGANGDGPPLG